MRLMAGLVALHGLHYMLVINPHHSLGLSAQRYIWAVHRVGQEGDLLDYWRNPREGAQPCWKKLWARRAQYDEVFNAVIQKKRCNAKDNRKDFASEGLWLLRKSQSAATKLKQHSLLQDSIRGAKSVAFEGHSS